MKLFTFLFINFVVAFISDIVLNDLSSNFGIVKSLKPYFYKQSIIQSGIYASITIEIALLITMIIYYIIFTQLTPNNYKLLIYFCLISYCVGYIMDVIIHKFNIFGNRLDPYYNEFGAGMWGAISLVFSVIISYFIQVNILPLL